MFGRQRSFSGGYYFGNLEGSIHSRIEEAPIPENVVIPLQQGFGQAALPLVKAGDWVQAGQIIAAGEKLCSPVHATINGVIRSFPEILNHLGQKVPAIEIDGTDSPDFIRLARFFPRFEKKKPAEIRTILYRSGVAALGKKGIPTQFNSSSLKVDQVRCVVVSALNATPFSLTNEVFLKPKLHQFLTGLFVLNMALENVPVYVVINSFDEEIAGFLKSQQKKNPWLKVFTQKPKYPLEEEQLLLNSLFSGSKKKRQEISDGAVLLEASDIIHVYEAVIEGHPLIDRFVALGGSGFVKNVPLRVRIGTPVSSIVEAQTKRELGLRIIVGNFLTDPAYPTQNFPLSKSINRLVALIEPKEDEVPTHSNGHIQKDFFDFFIRFFRGAPKKVNTQLNGEPRPCISCGYCEEVCPVGLLPFHLGQAAEKGDLKEIKNLGLDRCIDCGLCSYVCPSKIPLYNQILSAKRVKEHV